jgi:hypothetical protein
MQLPSHSLHSLTKTIEAACYNRVRLALTRAGKPVRVALPNHRGLEMIVENRLWLCVNGILDDLPVLSFHDFETAGRTELHAPVRCRMSFYHTHAGLIMGSVLDALIEALDGSAATDA